MYKSLEEICEMTTKEGKPFWKIVQEDDCREQGISEGEAFEQMRGMYQAMREADDNYDGKLKSASGLVGTDGEKMHAAREAGKGHICVNQIGSLMSVFFTDQKVRDFESAVTSNTEQYADYFGYLLDRGIYIAPSQFETMFISDAHTEEDIEKTCKLAGEALCNLDF